MKPDNPTKKLRPAKNAPYGSINPQIPPLIEENEFCSNYLSHRYRRTLERRDGILVYTGETLKAAVDVIGRVSVELFAANDALDTDFTASIPMTFVISEALLS